MRQQNCIVYVYATQGKLPSRVLHVHHATCISRLPARSVEKHTSVPGS